MNTDTKAAQAEKHTYDGGVTQETINKWKAQHRKVTRSLLHVWGSSMWRLPLYLQA